MVTDESPAGLTQGAAAGERLLLVSNRGPVTYDVTRDGRLRPTRGSGGVVTALEAVRGQRPVRWIACAMTEGDRRAAAELAADPVARDDWFSQGFVVLPRDVYRKYYEVFANRVIWFLQHYLWNAPYEPKIDARMWDAWESGYVPANAAFADAVVAELEQGGDGVVMLQDYHLYLAAARIRERAPGVVLQHFTHIPWPEPRYWQLLPQAMRREICESMVANDIVGLQTERDVTNFLATAWDNLPGVEVDASAGLLRYSGREVTVRAYPISVDPARLRRTVRSAEARRHVARLAALAGERTIVRVDRLDPSKNVLRGFEAFERLLRRRPEFRGHVRFLAFLVPTREKVPAYRRYREQVMALVERINTRYGRPGWQPIEIFYENHYLQALAGMTLYDALLVNPVLDGMNLVAKEGPIVNERAGVLVLSEGAGAHNQLAGWALSVAPADVEGTAETLERALLMPRPEREARAAALRLAIEREDVQAWMRAQVADIARLAASARARRAAGAALSRSLPKPAAEHLPV
ncbi:MAG TPA: trehalose-6-phosphate synthase [Chloroflexota bacterium]|jgi:trehalose 6-phosphate synthase